MGTSFRARKENGKGLQTFHGRREKVHFGIEEIDDISIEPLPEWRKNDTSRMMSDYIHKPSGRLKLKIEESPWRSNGLRKTWSDGKCQRIENILNEFIDGMIIIAGKLHELTLEQQERKRKEEEQRILREQIIKLYEEEDNKVNRLMSDMSNWNKSIQLRAYIRAVKKTHIKGSDWIKWAYAQADRLDPLKESPPSILDRPKPTRSWW